MECGRKLAGLTVTGTKQVLYQRNAVFRRRWIGIAYRAKTLQGICARLGIHLIYCRPYAPEGKGKLERWHRTVRDQFLSELDPTRIQDLSDLNARLWAWLEAIYHRLTHSSLHGQTPL